MNSQVFLWINIGVGLVFVALFLWKRGVKDPSRLQLRTKNKKSLFKTGTLSPEARASSVDPGAKVRDLNAKFLYNAHDWDAYDVLGIPAGSSYEIAQKAYEIASQKADSKTQDFLKTALETIRKN
jgi:hypothetical protein